MKSQNEKSEKGIADDVLKYIRSIDGAWAFKVVGGPYQERGVPDIVGCYNGHFFAFELKRVSRRKLVTKSQADKLQKIAQAGGIAGVVSSAEEVEFVFSNAHALSGAYCGFTKQQGETP